MAEDPQGNKMINVSNPREVVLSNQAARLWASMATHGDPNANAIFSGGETQSTAGATVATAEIWPAFTRDHDPATMVFGYTDPPGQVQRSYRFEKCNFWDEQFAKLIPHT